VEGRSAAYRGATRAEAERKYHEAARSAAAEGYAPTSEEWSSEAGEQVLTVTFAYLPDQAPAVLAALGPGDAPLPPPPPTLPAPPLRGISRPSALDPERAPQPPATRQPPAAWATAVGAVEDRVPALKGRVPLAAGIGVAVVVAVLWFFVLGGKPSATSGNGPTPPPAATVQPTQLSKLAASDVGYTANAAVGANIRFHFTVTNHGLTPAAPLHVQLSGLASSAEALACEPACTRNDSGGDLGFDFADGLTPGQSVTYEINFKATTSGVASWTLVIFEGPSLEVYKGNGSITVQ